MLPFVLAAFMSITSGTDPLTEAPLVPGAVALEEPGRYSSARSYDNTLLYYQRYFRSRGGITWRHIVNLPSVKAKHIQSRVQSTRWEGINIYETKGYVRVYVIPRPKASANTTAE